MLTASTRSYKIHIQRRNLANDPKPSTPSRTGQKHIVSYQGEAEPLPLLRTNPRAPSKGPDPPGLELAIVRRLATDPGGKIIYSMAKRDQTQFSLQLPWPDREKEQ